MDTMENSIEACRTCGTYFFTTSNLLRHLFTSSNDADLVLIHSQLKAWNVEICESDGYPQTICTSCILEFQKIFKFRKICMETQENLRFLNNIREKNIQVKTELADPDEDKFCGFIYVDDLSDDEGNGSVTPFDFSHMPIKMEDRSEAATVPNEMAYTMNEDYNKMHDAVIPDKGAMYDTTDNFKNLNCADVEDKKPDINQLEEVTKCAASKASAVRKCNLCTYTAVNQTALNQHIQLSHEIKDHECHICGKQFKNSTAMRLKYHIKWHKLSKHIKCAQCGFYCASKYILNEHKRAVHAKVPCEICNKQFTVKKLKAHMREHEMNANQSVELNGDGFQAEHEQNEQIWNTHSMDVEQYDDSISPTYTIICAQCEQTFKSATELQYHVQHEHNFESTPLENSFDKLQQSTASLNISNQSYRFEELENIHKIVEEEASDGEDSDPTIYTHFIDDQEPEAASESISDIDSNDINNIENEPTDDGMINNEINQFACAQCPQTFRNVDKLLAHHAEHSKQRTEFKCKLCNKTFKLMVQLNRHMKNHNKALL